MKTLGLIPVLHASYEAVTQPIIQFKELRVNANRYFRWLCSLPRRERKRRRLDF